MLMCKVKVVPATGVSVNERGHLVVETKDPELSHVVVDASDYPNMVCTSCDVSMLPACKAGMFDIMTENAVVPLDFRLFPAAVKEIHAASGLHAFALGKLSTYLKEKVG